MARGWPTSYFLFQETTPLHIMSKLPAVCLGDNVFVFNDEGKAGMAFRVLQSSTTIIKRTTWDKKKSIKIEFKTCNPKDAQIIYKRIKKIDENCLVGTWDSVSKKAGVTSLIGDMFINEKRKRVPEILFKNSVAVVDISPSTIISNVEVSLFPNIFTNQILDQI